MFSSLKLFVSKYFILILILLLVGIVGLFVFNNKKKSSVTEPIVQAQPTNINNPTSNAAMDSDEELIDEENTPVVVNNNHYRGNPEANITIIEYSDFECPYCKKLHPTLKTVVEKYPDQVSWVYRHFPLSEHKYSVLAAQAAECVSSVAGEDKFWEYGDSLFANASRGLNQTKLVQIANDLGIDGEAVQTCLDSGEMASVVESNKTAGLQSGVSGTPGMVLMVNGKVEGLIPGALPLPQLEEIIGRYL